MQWWLQHMPMQRVPMNGDSNGKGVKISGVAAPDDGPMPENCDQVMLVRRRKSISGSLARHPLRS